MATHPSILDWRIPQTEEPGGLQSTGSQRVGYDWATNTLSSMTQEIPKFSEVLVSGAGEWWPDTGFLFCHRTTQVLPLTHTTPSSVLGKSIQAKNIAFEDHESPCLFPSIGHKIAVCWVANLHQDSFKALPKRKAPNQSSWVSWLTYPVPVFKAR